MEQYIIDRYPFLNKETVRKIIEKYKKEKNLSIDEFINTLSFIKTIQNEKIQNIN